MGISSSISAHKSTTSINGTFVKATTIGVALQNQTVVSSGALTIGVYTAALLSLTGPGEVQLLYIAAPSGANQATITIEITVDDTVVCTEAIDVTAANDGVYICPLTDNVDQEAAANIYFRQSFSIRIKSTTTAAVNIGYRWNGVQ